MLIYPDSLPRAQETVEELLLLSKGGGLSQQQLEIGLGKVLHYLAKAEATILQGQGITLQNQNKFIPEQE